MTYLTRGDVVLSVACTSVTTLTVPIVTPFPMLMLASEYLPIDDWAMSGRPSETSCSQ